MTGILQIEKSGNIFSLIQALNSLKIDFKIIKSLNDFDECNRIVIPGVGSFNNSMNFWSVTKWSFIKDFEILFYITLSAKMSPKTKQKLLLSIL